MALQQLLICILYQYLGTALNTNIVCSLSPPHVSEQAIRNHAQVLISLQNNKKLLTRIRVIGIKSFDRHPWRLARELEVQM